MTKKRTAIPQKTRDQVLKEFNYRCALCGTSNPQIHHMDENPTNHDPSNLLALCPNCHLTDQHNPTVRIDPDKLRLFRKYKDPAILSTEFEPLFQRLRFLDDVRDGCDINKLQSQVKELVSFVQSLQMGAFYGQQFDSLLKKPSRVYSDATHEQEVKQHQQEYREQIRREREKVYDLAIEMLRYQPWERPNHN